MSARNEMTPAAFLARLFGDEATGSLGPAVLGEGSELTGNEWSVNWNQYGNGERERLVDGLPDHVAFRTSGHTGAPVRWLRAPDQLVAEARLLIDVLGSEHDLLVSWAPVQHLYGFLVDLMVPALTGVPVRFCPVDQFGALDIGPARRPLFATIPSALVHLLRLGAHLRGLERLTVVHSTASLPLAPDRVLRALPPHARLVELFGSTETGLVATRAHGPRVDHLWTLAADVTFAMGSPPADGRLAIRSPRIAANDGGERLREWHLDDIVTAVTNRQFRFEGRRTRLVKVNGRRVDLDQVERILRETVECRDLACAAAHDRIRGERIDVLIVTDEPATRAEQVVRQQVRAALPGAAMPVRVVLVQRIERSSTGKLRALRQVGGG